MSDYKALVIAARLRPHPNADRLQICNANHYQVIVGKDVNDENLLLFFEQGGQLSETFCETNKLLRSSGGMFEENRRVKAIKLRGVRSEGFAIPISSLAHFGGDVDSLKEGEELCVWNGVEICRKYENPQTLRAKRGNVQKTGVRVKLKTFPEHVDTANFRREGKWIPKGSLIYLSEKLHGCVTANTKVLMASLEKKRIKDIVVGDVVVGLKDGQVIESKVLNVFDNGKSGDWLRIKGRRPGGCGDPFWKVDCTSNHEFWDPINNDYVRADKLSIGDSVVVIRHSPSIPYFQRQVLIGKTLGDGCFNSNGSFVEWSHKADHVEYLEWTARCLDGLMMSGRQHRVSGYGTKMVAARTLASPFIRDMFSGWGESIPQTVLDELGPIALAFLYMDDGSLSHSSSQEDRANIATCSYSESDVLRLAIAIKKLGPSGVVFKTGSYWRIRFNEQEADKLFSLITPYVPDVMQYKLPERYRGYMAYRPISIPSYKPILMEAKISEIGSIETERRYDIQTETQNFFANGILVHNSSHRIAYCNVDMPRLKSFFEFLSSFHGRIPYLSYVRAGFTKLAHALDYVFGRRTRYALIHGTRRVVIGEAVREGAGYYKNDAFRFHAIYGIVPAKDEVLYGEIVGWANDSTPIMPRHSTKEVPELKRTYGDEFVYAYGTTQGACRFYVYRITHVNSDGRVVDYSWPQVVGRCQELGVSCVPEVEEVDSKPLIYDGDFERLFKLVDALVNGCDGDRVYSSKLDPTHPQEGVVIRVETPDGRTCWYKHKSYAFMMMEGFSVASGAVDTEDAQKPEDEATGNEDEEQVV